MIETAWAPTTQEYEHELAPNVWLRQTKAEGQFVEIVLPPFELNDLLDECERQFPIYAIQVLEALARSRPEAIPAPAHFTDEGKTGLKNTQLLGMVLARHQVRDERATRQLPELHQAFGLAMQGRLRLTADLPAEIL